MTETPNILVFMTDQQRAETIDPRHRLKAITPHIDRFRDEGVWFPQAYGPSPHCCPCRASFFTGLYPSEHGVWNNVDVTNALSRELFPSARLWSESLVEAGYSTAFSGKWHVSHTRLPREYGWESVEGLRQGGLPACGDAEAQYHAIRVGEVAALLDGAAAGSRNGNGQHGRRPGEIDRPGYPAYTHFGTTENPFGDGDVTREGIEKMQALAGGESPWCLYIGTLGPHDPYIPPQEFLDLYADQDLPPLPASFADSMDDKPGFYRRTRDRFAQLSEEEHREAIRHYMAFCSYEDHLFGQVLEALEQTGQADRTVVVFLSDHGDYVAEHGLWCKGVPAFDGAYHVPAVVRVPERFGGSGARRVDRFISLMDFGPTLLELAGVEPPQPMSGRSLAPWLRGETPEDWRTALFFQTNGNEAYGIQRSIDRSVEAGVQCVRL